MIIVKSKAGKVFLATCVLFNNDCPVWKIHWMEPISWIWLSVSSNVLVLAADSDPLHLLKQKCILLTSYKFKDIIIILLFIILEESGEKTGRTG